MFETGYIMKAQTTKEKANMPTKLKDALNNIGLPQYAQMVENDLLNLSKKQIEDIKDTVETCDEIYKESFIKTETRETVVKAIQDWCFTFKNFSLWMDRRWYLVG